MFIRLLLLLILIALLLAGCGVPRQSAPDPDPAGLPWEQVVEQARGTTVNVFMWGGDANINRYVNEFLAQRLQAEYQITIKQTPLGDTAEAVNKLLGEKTAGKRVGGSMDLLWINGENFRTLRQGELLYGPWAQDLPSASLVAWGDSSVAYDFGETVDGYEAPWGRAQFVLIYDSAQVPDPPRTLRDLLAWAKMHPRRFTYPAPPDFTGSAFLRHMFYGSEGQQVGLRDGWNQEGYDATAPAVWQYLRELKPHQWRGGDTFPQDVEQLNSLFAAGEVDFTMSYNPTFASGAISRGTFPSTTRTVLLHGGTLANTHYLAIPFNAANKAGAMIVANVAQSPAAQIEKAKPDVWGDLPILSPTRLSDQDGAALEAVPRGPATLPPEELAANALPEPGSAWVDRIEQDWQREVLKQP